LHSSSVVRVESEHYLALQTAVVAVATQVHLLDVSVVVAEEQIVGVLYELHNPIVTHPAPLVVQVESTLHFS
jgi:hypothetical protein